MLEQIEAILKDRDAHTAAALADFAAVYAEDVAIMEPNTFTVALAKDARNCAKWANAAVKTRAARGLALTACHMARRYDDAFDRAALAYLRSLAQ